MQSLTLSKIKKTIKQFDLFGVELNLNINQQEKYRSACGGIASLIMISLLSYIFTNRFINIINKEDYTIKVQNLKSANPTYNIMNSENFMLALKINDPLQDQSQNTTKTSYNISIQQFIQKSNQNGTKTKQLLKLYKLEKCTIDHFEAVDFKDYSYILKQLNSYLCLPLDYELYLQGSYNSEIFFFPKIIIELCENDQETCYSKEEIQEFNKNRSSTITLSTLIKSSLFLLNETTNSLYSACKTIQLDGILKNEQNLIIIINRLGQYVRLYFQLIIIVFLLFYKILQLIDINSILTRPL